MVFLIPARQLKDDQIRLLSVLEIELHRCSGVLFGPGHPSDDRTRSFDGEMAPNKTVAERQHISQQDEALAPGSPDLSKAETQPYATKRTRLKHVKRALTCAQNR